MPWKSRWSVDIPNIHLASYVFKSPHDPLKDTPLLIDAEKPEYFLTHQTYREWSKRLAAGLRRAGIGPGDRLLLYSGNSVFFPVVFQGTIMAGGVFTGANPNYVPRELAYQLKDSGAKMLITANDSLDSALEAARSIDFPLASVFVMGDGYEMFENRASSVKGIRHWSTLLSSSSEGSRFAWDDFDSRQKADQVAVINYSSGTTGAAKGVEITHRNYVANCMQVEYLSTLVPDHEERQKRARNLSFLPMYHVFGQTHHAVRAVVTGTPVYVMKKYDFLKMLAFIERYRITNLALVPPIAVSFTKRPEVAKFDLSSVESGTCGAAPTSAETITAFERLFGGKVQLKQAFGMTEMTCSVCLWDPSRRAEANKNGELLPNLEGMLVDEEENEVGVGERGELWLRGPSVMKGYWRKPEATQEMMSANGWLKTGDIALKHSDGCLSIVDRKKELIKVKGMQVAPAELEGLLLEHPAVADAAVVGVTIAGEECPRAYVVLGQHQRIAPSELASWLAQKVVRHKRLTGGVVCVDSIPKNPSGKILRRFIRDRAREEIGDGKIREARL